MFNKRLIKITFFDFFCFFIYPIQHQHQHRPQPLHKSPTQHTSEHTTPTQQKREYKTFFAIQYNFSFLAYLFQNKKQDATPARIDSAYAPNMRVASNTGTRSPNGQQARPIRFSLSNDRGGTSYGQPIKRIVFYTQQQHTHHAADIQKTAEKHAFYQNLVYKPL